MFDFSMQLFLFLLFMGQLFRDIQSGQDGERRRGLIRDLRVQLMHHPVKMFGCLDKLYLV